MDRKEQPSLASGVVIANDAKENSKPSPKRLKSGIVYSPIKFKDKVLKNGDVSDQPLSCLSNKVNEIKNPHELSQPRTKRRRVLSSDADDSCLVAKESDIKFPFSPVYKRTRSFHKKNLPISGLTVQQKYSVSNTSGKG